MATPNRRKISNLTKKIESSPWRFDFFQLVKLLENETNASNEVGDFTPVSLEKIKFKTKSIGIIRVKANETRLSARKIIKQPNIKRILGNKFKA